MLKIGYTLSSEEHNPLVLVKNAQIAEEMGFSFLGISDHFHPWVDKQGQSPFVWNVIGALSQVTKKVEIFIEVNCPILRYHPAIITQAASTSQYQLNGRFVLGIGTGENLNEHIVGHGWPPIKIRQEMLKEAIEIMRQLWQGGYQSYFGKYFTIDAARIYTLPEQQIRIIISAMGPKSAKIAGELGDGLVTTTANPEVISNFQNHGGRGKPMYVQMSVCYDPDPEKAKKIIKQWWPNTGLPKPLNSELRLPQDFQAAAKLVHEDQLAEKIPIGSDPKPVIKKIQEMEKAGFDHIYIHNIGPNQEEFLSWANREIIPQFKTGNSLNPDYKSSSKQPDLGSIAFAHEINSKR